MAHDAGAKAYVQSLGFALHEEWKARGVHVTVLGPGPTEPPALSKLGLDPATMPMKPLKVNQVVREGLGAISTYRPFIVPGRVNRIMQRVIPATLKRSMLAKMFEKQPPSSIRQRV